MSTDRQTDTCHLKSLLCWSKQKAFQIQIYLFSKQCLLQINTINQNKRGKIVSRLTATISIVASDRINCHFQHFHFYQSIFIIKVTNMTFTHLQIVCSVKN